MPALALSALLLLCSGAAVQEQVSVTATGAPASPVKIVEVAGLAFPNRISVNRLSERVIVLKLADPANPNQMVAIASARGIVVIDSLSPHKLAAVFRRVIAEEFGRDDFAYLINTHSHQDHTSGNQVFGDLPIIAHRGCRSAMQRRKANLERFLEGGERWSKDRIAELRQELAGHPAESERRQEIRANIGQIERVVDSFNDGFEITYPTVLFKDELVLDLGDLSLELLFFGELHTSDNIVIFVPEERLLCVGDLLYPDYLNYGWFSDGNLDVERWLAVLGRALDGESRVGTVIGGHERIWTGEQLAVHRAYIRELWTVTAAAMAAGLNLQSVQERLALEGAFPHLHGMANPESSPTIDEQHRGNIEAFWRQQ